MVDRPILFSAPMVRALLEGRKSQTRRVLKPQPVIYPSLAPSFAWGKFCGMWPDDWFGYGNEIDGELPYVVCDRLWVREAHYLTDDGDYEQAVCAADTDEVAVHLETVAHLEVSHPSVDWSRHKRLRPPMFMPRWASRLTLTVTDVRVQRLQEISREDAIAEGLGLASNKIEEFWRWPEPLHERLWLSPIAAYRELWNGLNAGRGFGWDANPWVVAVTFTVGHHNLDEAGNA